MKKILLTILLLLSITGCQKVKNNSFGDVATTTATSTPTTIATTTSATTTLIILTDEERLSARYKDEIYGIEYRDYNIIIKPTNKAIVSSGHINYINDGGHFEPIDNTFVSTSSDNLGGMLGAKSKNKWEMKKASYNVSVPEYADEWFTFIDKYKGKNEEIELRPNCDHVKGTLTKPNEITYFEACDGHDLIYVALPDNFVKKIKINKDIVVEDIRISFEYKTKNNIIVKDKNTKEIEKYNKKNKKTYKNKKYILNNYNIPTSFKNMIVWDDENAESIKVEWYKNEFTKIIPKEFIDNSVGDVYSDTTTGFYGDDGDGYLKRDDVASFSSVRNNATSEEINTTNVYIRQTNWQISSGRFYLERAFMNFDLSSLTGVTVATATLGVICNEFNDSNSDIYSYTVITESTQSDPTTLVVADFNNWNDTAWTNEIDNGSLSINGAETFTFNASGITGITSALGDWFSIVLRDGHDVELQAPGVGTVSQMGIYSQNNATQSNRPYLEITYSDAAAASPGLGFQISEF